MSLQNWLEKYAISHRNPTNILLHIICVPLIIWSLFGMLYCLPAPVPFLPGGAATVVALGAVIRYLSLSRRGALYLALFATIGIALIQWLDQHVGNVLYGSIAVFFLAWIGQFIGHEIEGKKPSFLEDLQFLLIGPLFVLKHLGVKL